EPPDLTYQPPGFRPTYFVYPAAARISRPLNGWICTTYLWPHIRSSKPDLILNYWLYPDGFSAVQVARRLGVPVVVGAIGSDIRRRTDPFSRYLVRQTMLDADAVITVSEELRQQAIAQGIRPSKTTTILNGCDRSVFYPGDRVEARRKLGID